MLVLLRGNIKQQLVLSWGKARLCNFLKIVEWDSGDVVDLSQIQDK